MNYLIEILRKKQGRGQQKKTLALPSRKGEQLGRRRGKGDIYINYYDRGADALGDDIQFTLNANDALSTFRVGPGPAAGFPRFPYTDSNTPYGDRMDISFYGVPPC